MKTITFFFDYTEDPVWYREDETEIKDNGLPPICEDNEELKSMMDELVEEYAGLFINNTHEFRYVGFEDEESKIKFCEKVNKFIALLREQVEPEYTYIKTNWESDFE